MADEPNAPENKPIEDLPETQGPPAMETLHATPSGVRPGMELDHYRILQLIGEGTFGSVFVAEQHRPIRRRVAIKVLKPAMSSHDVVARFEAERQALAMMDHPNIAKVLDAGTVAGRPYFVMELVKGLPITEFCDVRKLGIRERLMLFRSVCLAVQHAHQKGIIHRDIKPSNVLVSLNEGAAVAKIIDFGIAKAMHGRLSEKTVYTDYRQLIGTPQYMSPEQAEMTGLDIDTRSDIYSLGVLLYELLTGTTPLDAQKLRSAGYGELHQMICESESPRPSTRIITLKDAASKAAETRGLDVGALSFLLRSDLDWIVMKAIEKDRDRRYATANALARDVERYLADEPVEASPPSTGYRLRKFVRRHRAPIQIVAAFILLLVLSTIISGWQAFRATRAQAAADAAKSAALEAEAHTAQERDRALVEKKRADEEAAIAQAINDFFDREVLGMAGAANQMAAGLQPDRDLKVRDALDFAARRIHGQFEKRPKVEAAVQNAIASAYRALGDYPKARVHMEEALRLRIQNEGPLSSKSLATSVWLARLAIDQGDFATATNILKDDRERAERVFGPHSPELINVLDAEGLLALNQGVFSDAERLYEQVLAARRTLLGPRHPEVLSAMEQLSIVYEDSGRYPEAERTKMDVLRLRQAILGTLHPSTLATMNNLAVIYDRQGKSQEALQLFQKVLDGDRKILGDGHPSTLLAQANVAGVYGELHQYELARSMFEQALEGDKAILGPEHPRTLKTMCGLARVYGNLGNYEKAESLLRQALDKQVKVLGETHFDTIGTIRGLGWLYLQHHELEKSRDFCQRAVHGARLAFGDKNPIAVMTLGDLSEVYRQLGDLPKAQTLCQQALDNGRQVLPPNNRDLLLIITRLADVLAARQEFVRAEPLYAEALRGRRETVGDRDPATVALARQMQFVYVQMNQPQKAVALQPLLDPQASSQATPLTVSGQQSDSIVDMSPGPVHRRTATGLDNLPDASTTNAKLPKEQVSNLTDFHPVAQTVIDLGKAANAKLDHFTYPPRVLVAQGIAFKIADGDHAVLRTATQADQDFPAELSVSTQLRGVTKVHVLVNAVWATLPSGTEIGRITLAFDHHRKAEFPLRVMRTIRETWAFASSAEKTLPGDPAHGISWRNVVSEMQNRGEDAVAYIDMLSLSVPPDLRSATLESISICNVDDADGNATGAGLMVMAITTETAIPPTTVPSTQRAGGS